MGFKIGDRVRFKPEYNHTGYGEGIVTHHSMSDVNPWSGVTFDGIPYRGRWMDWSLELATPPPSRGPKPLTLTGGTRFTVRQGWTTKCPSGIYQLGRYNR